MFRSSLAVAFCAALPLVLAQDSTTIDLAGRIPNAEAFSSDNSGINCQYLGNTECQNNTPLNRFGRALEAAGSWTTEFCQADSDGDGLSNGQELGDPCCNWKPGDDPQRTINLSHPGLASEKNTGFTCPSPSVSPSVSASASATASVDASVTASPAASTSSANASEMASPAPSRSPIAAADTTTTTGTGVGTSTGSDFDSNSATDSDSSGDSGTSSTPTTPDSEGTAEPSPSQDATTESVGSDSDSADDDDGSVCFPGRATVKLEDGSRVTMRDLRVGDRVQVGTGRFSDVFMFSHKLGDVRHRFVTLKADAADGRSISLSLTKGHFVFANGEAVPAEAVRVGDSLELSDEESCATVTEIYGETLSGLYNPQTVDGNIVVDGVKASTYTHSVKHVTAHCMMMPVRAVFRYFGLHLTALEGGADTIASILPSQVGGEKRKFAGIFGAKARY